VRLELPYYCTALPSYPVRMLGAASGVGIDHNSDYYERASTTMVFGIRLFPRINIIRVILLNIIHLYHSFTTFVFLSTFSLIYQALKVTMKKHPSAFKLVGDEIIKKNDAVGDVAVTLFDGKDFILLMIKQLFVCFLRNE